MSMREIPRNEWPAFLESFSRQHRQWLVSVEGWQAGDSGESTVIEQQPLVEIAADPEDGPSIHVTVEKTGSGGTITDSLAAPARLLLFEAESGSHEALEIETEKGRRLRLRFRSAILPEMVDGA